MLYNTSMERAVKTLTKDDFNKIQETNVSLVLFYAEGCPHCEGLKPKFEEYAKAFPELGFYQIDIAQGYEEYVKYAEKEPEVKYEAVEGSEDVKEIPVLDDQGNPVMSYKISVPSVYVYHKANVTADNPLGFVGGADGATDEEIFAIIQGFLGLLNEQSKG